MKGVFTSDCRSPRLTGRLWFLICLATWFAAQPISGAETPSAPDDYIIVSDDGDVVSTDEQETPITGNATEPEELPTDEPTDSAETDAEEAADPSADDAGPQPEETSQADGARPTAAPQEDSAAEVAPNDEPPSQATSVNEPTAADPSAVETSESDSQGADHADDGIETIGPAVRGRSATEPDTKTATSEENASRMAPEGASFRGILPAKTTEEELKTAWGPAKDVRNTPAGRQYIYYSKPFKQVVVTVIDQKVDTILIRLEKEFEPKALARQLLLEDVEPATIFNPKGQMLGMAFPERGVLFGFAPGVPVHVGQIVLEPINSQPFVTRAEKNVRRKPADALADAQYAIEIDPEYDRAHAIHAQVLMQLGAFEKALAAIDKALSLQPTDADFQLTKALIQFQLQHYDEAEKLATSLAEDTKVPPLVGARAELLRGDLLSRGPERRFDKAIKHHTAAIERAEKVSTASAGPIRRAAKELLVEANVAVAHDVAWGNWRQKDKVVPRWIDRATSYCDNLIERDYGEECVRLRLLEQSLNAFAGMKDAPDVTETIDAMTSLARKLGEGMTDSGQREVMQWQLGEALASAMFVCQQQGKADAATQLGQQALACFEKSGKYRATCHESEFLIGKIYYRLGAIQAVEHDDHAKALAWYDEAIPLLERPLPLSARPETGQIGELFVSMAVSYWESEKQEEAVRLTQQGANLMEAAVRQFDFPAEALAVPYGNLASMHAGMGQVAEAKRFAELASQADTQKRR